MGRVHLSKITYARALCYLITLVFIAAGCLPPPAISPTPLLSTETVTVTPSPSATIIWFPATATFTPAPTQVIEPTQDWKPGIGEILLEDSFSDIKQWQTARTGVGSIAYGNQELTLAVAAPKGTLISLRNASSFDDFYAEMDVVPSLCREGDSYGLLLRASSAGDFYRLLIGCDGRVRFERVKNSRMEVLKDWTVSGLLPPGGMMRSRVGLWALDDEMRVFINGTYLFSVRDPVFREGILGAYARSAGDTPLTVNFSNLRVYAIEPQPGLKVVPTLKPTATSKP